MTTDIETMVRSYYAERSPTAELEARIISSTTDGNQLFPNLSNYNNVISKLKSLGWSLQSSTANSGDYYMRINCEMTGNRGTYMSKVRAEINGLYDIQKFCENDMLLADSEYTKNHVKFINKENISRATLTDYRVRAAVSKETEANIGIRSGIISSWSQAKKSFRFINRLTFTHPQYPFQFDVSIVKSNSTPVRTFAEANVFSKPYKYEIEIEAIKEKIWTRTVDDVYALFNKCIKIMLSGIQSTNYPVSWPEQTDVLNAYFQLTGNAGRTSHSSLFIGPSPVTLQMENVVSKQRQGIPNIRSDFVVTEKADGERCMMYISGAGKVYLVSNLLEIIFTGAVTTHSEYFQSLLDGELIRYNKQGTFINMFAAFDIYFQNGRDCRALPFTNFDGSGKTRYGLARSLVGKMTIRPITGQAKSPIQLVVKDFYPKSSASTIFEASNQVLSTNFPYDTDGLIYPHMYMGVGLTAPDGVVKNMRVTWKWSFKWKPPEFNTIDFLVRTVKNPTTNKDEEYNLYEQGANMTSTLGLKQYKKVELMCGFNELKDGVANPCQSLIDESYLIAPRNQMAANMYVPKRFSPTSPSDPNAGLTNIIVDLDNTQINQMRSQDNDTFFDNSIVEFRYDFDAPDGFHWVPIRVRHDKTLKLQLGEREYGNAFGVANNIWKSINVDGRIDSHMIRTGDGIPTDVIDSDVYYAPSSATAVFTHALKNFHNLFVKTILIQTVSPPKKGTLIDLACGKAGDMSKWAKAKLSVVYGIDVSSANISDPVDGCCMRYITSRREGKVIPRCFFQHGDSSKSILSGDAFYTDAERQYNSLIFGTPHTLTEIGKGVQPLVGVGQNGFDVCSCQFAIHYFFKDMTTLRTFIQNVADCTKVGGYFIGTCYNGSLVFNALKTVDSITKMSTTSKKIWEITKQYTQTEFLPNESYVGMQIDVYQDSINQTIPEYLVHLDLLTDLMREYGFEISNDHKIAGIESFEYLFNLMMKSQNSIDKYGNAKMMSDTEKFISFLNCYFIYKKRGTRPL